VPNVRDDTDLDVSLALDIDTVPTLLRFAGGVEVERTVGWLRTAWEELTGRPGLGPSCRSTGPAAARATGDPDLADELLVRTTVISCAPDARVEARWRTRSRRCSTGAGRTACRWYRRLRLGLLRMLAGTSRAPDQVVGVVPAQPRRGHRGEGRGECGAPPAARPEYLPVVLAAVHAACTDESTPTACSPPPGAPGRRSW